MLTAHDIEELTTEFNTNLTFRHDLALASSKDPPMDKSAAGDIAGWLLGQVSELRKAKDQSISRARLEQSHCLPRLSETKTRLNWLHSIISLP